MSSLLLLQYSSPLQLSNFDNLKAYPGSGDEERKKRTLCEYHASRHLQICLVNTDFIPKCTQRSGYVFLEESNFKKYNGNFIVRQGRALEAT